MNVPLALELLTMAETAAIAVGPSPARRISIALTAQRWNSSESEAHDPLGCARGTHVGALLSMVCWFGIYLVVTT